MHVYQFAGISRAFKRTRHWIAAGIEVEERPLQAAAMGMGELGKHQNLHRESDVDLIHSSNLCHARSLCREERVQPRQTAIIQASNPNH